MTDIRSEIDDAFGSRISITPAFSGVAVMLMPKIIRSVYCSIILKSFMTAEFFVSILTDQSGSERIA